MDQIIVYGDYASQPSKAVFALLHIESDKIKNWKIQEVNLSKLEQFSKEFKAINPLSKIPALKHGDFVMRESHAIMKYICLSCDLEQHWYPYKDPKSMAQVDMYLDWHHSTVRMGSEGYIFRKYLSPFVGKAATESQIQESYQILKRSLRYVEKVWLNGKQKFLTGNKVSIADLSLGGEIQTLLAVDNFPLEKEFPLIWKWHSEHMMTIPGYRKVCEIGAKKLRIWGE